VQINGDVDIRSGTGPDCGETLGNVLDLSGRY
jgi:hypothetical protein